MPKVGGGGGGGAGRFIPPAPVEEEKKGFLDRLGSEVDQIASTLPRAIGTIIGAVGSDLVALPFRTGRGLTSGEPEGLANLFRPAEEAPDFLDDIGLGAVGEVVDRIERTSAIARDIISPTVESLATSFGQGFSTIPNPASPFAAEQTLNRLRGVDDESPLSLLRQGVARRVGADEDATPAEIALTGLGFDEAAERVAIDRQEREGLVLIPFVEDVGNIALAAGGAGVAARVGGRVTGSAALTNVGRTASAVARQGRARGVAALEDADLPVSRVGEGLGQVARPLRTAFDATPLGEGRLTGRLREAAYDGLNRALAEGFASGDLSTSRAKILSRAAEFVNPRRAELNRLNADADAATKEYLNGISRSLSEGGIRLDAYQRLSDLPKFLDADDLARVQAAYRKIVDESGGELPSDLPVGLKPREMSDQQALAMLDAVAESGVTLRRDLLPFEEDFGVDLRRHALDLLRLSLHERVRGMEPGSLTKALRSIHELDANAYLLAEGRQILVDAFGEDATAQILSLTDGIEDVRLMEQTLPSTLDPADVRRIEAAARSYREYQGGVERARAAAGMLPDSSRIGSRLDPETGEVLPGDAPTVFDSTAPNAPFLRRFDRAQAKVDKAKVSLSRLDKAIKEAGGLDSLLDVERLAKERAQVYEAIFEATKEIRGALDLVDEPQTLDAALSMIDAMIEVGADIDQIVTGGTPEYVVRAQQNLKAAMADVKAQVEVRRQQMAEGGTPMTRLRANLRTVARLSRNINEDNALESVTAIAQALDEVDAITRDLGIVNMLEVTANLRARLADFDAVRNQRLTNQQRLRELLLSEEAPPPPSPGPAPLTGAIEPGFATSFEEVVSSLAKTEELPGGVTFEGIDLDDLGIKQVDHAPFEEGPSAWSDPEAYAQWVDENFVAVSNFDFRGMRRSSQQDAVSVAGVQRYVEEIRSGRFTGGSTDPNVAPGSQGQLPIVRWDPSSGTHVLDDGNHRVAAMVSEGFRAGPVLLDKRSPLVSTSSRMETLPGGKVTEPIQTPQTTRDFIERSRQTRTETGRRLPDEEVLPLLEEGVDDYLSELHDRGDLDWDALGELTEEFESNLGTVLYHGSLSGIEPGQVISPSGGPTVFRHASDRGLAYSTRDPGTAASYAELADSSVGDDLRRPVVYEVRAIDTPFEDPNYGNPDARPLGSEDLANKYGYVVVREIPVDEANAMALRAKQARTRTAEPGQAAPGDLPTTVRAPVPGESTTGFFGVTDPIRNRRHVETIIEDEVRQIGTGDGAVAAMLKRVEERLRVEQVPGNHAEIMGYLRRQMNSTVGREIRRNLKTNLPRERRSALKEVAATVERMTRHVDEVDPLAQSLRNLRNAETNMRTQRNRFLKRGKFAGEVKRARNTLNERAKHQNAVARAQQRLDDGIAEFLASPAAVPRAARTLSTYARDVFPEVAAILRTLDDPRAREIADDLDKAPTSLEELETATVTDPVTGEERALRVTYVPDTPSATDPAFTRRDRVDDLTDRPADFQRRQTVSDRPQVEDAFSLAQKQAVDTVKATIRSQLREDFTRQFTRQADDILTDMGHDVEGMSTTRKADLLRRAGYVEFKPNDLFGPFRKSRFTPSEGRWVKADLAHSMERYLRPAGAFEALVRESYDPLINAWKGSVLALRPLWQINNHLGNAALATFAAHVNVGDYFRFINTALDLQRRAKQGNLDDTLRIVKNTPGATLRNLRGRLTDGDIVREIDFSETRQLGELFDTSLLAGEVLDVQQQGAVRRGFVNRTESARARGRTEGATPLQQAAGRTAEASQRVTEKYSSVVNASYRVNSAVDDMNRALVYMAKGFEDPVTGRVDLDRAFDPDEGVRNAIQAFGAYNSMSPFERRWLRRVFPFYTWTRHITGVLWRHMTDISEVDRTILFAHVASVIGEPNEEEQLLPEWAASQIFRGYNEAGVPEFINPRGGDPFSEGLAPLRSIGSLREASAFLARSSGPFGSAFFERATGTDVLSGTPLSGVPGPRGEAPVPGLAQQVSESLPQVRLVRDFLRERSGESTIRLDDDTPLDIPFDPMSQRTVLDQFLRYMGITVATPLPVDEIARSEEENLRDRQRALQRAQESSSGSVFQQFGASFGLPESLRQG